MINMPSLLEPRLQGRYQKLLQEQLSLTTPVAAGVRSLPGSGKAFASTQAAYRFYGNEGISLPALAHPLLHAARQAVSEECHAYALVAHDWSNLHFPEHTSKKDRVSLSCDKDLGYELQTALMISDGGQPISPVYLGLRAQDGVHGTHSEQVEPAVSPLDSLQPVMDLIAGLNWSKPAVHIVDAEADSVAHYRQWHQAGHRFVVRADDEPRVAYDGREQPLGQVADQLRQRGQFRYSRDVEYQGKAAKQYVAEVAVLLTRPAHPQRRDGQPRRKIPGAPLALRLVVVEVRDEQNGVLARWLLLTNMSAEVSADMIALWYYWRWRIESYFKLLKSAGLNLEHWQQETAAALTRRLLVAAMACVVVWRLERDQSEPAQEVKKILIRLSGRQMKRKRPVTAPALLAGLWTLLAMLDILDHDDLRDLIALVAAAGLEGLASNPHPSALTKRFTCVDTNGFHPWLHSCAPPGRKQAPGLSLIRMGCRCAQPPANR
jgi:hypothetical protein